MKKQILDILHCPMCTQNLTLIDKEVVEGEVIDGALVCNGCQSSFRIMNGVPRMIVDLGDHKEIAESFGFQWAKKAEKKFEIDTVYGETEQEEAGDFFHCLGIDPDDLRGKVVLDAGCGCGQLTKALGKFGAEVFGIDIFSSIETVYEYCRSEDNVNIIQADVLNLPFRRESFDYVWSDEAICYSEETKRAFYNLCDVLKAPGKLFVRVYSKTDQSFVVKLRDFLRISHKIPRHILFYLCFLLSLPLSLIKRLLNKRAVTLKANALILFNALSPQFINRHTEEEVVSWFKEKKFYDINVVPISEKGVPVRGTKRS